MIGKRMLGVCLALSAVFIVGICGYVSIEGWSLFDSLYMTVITIASVGFMEVHDLSNQGRAFTIVLILCGSAILIYGLSVLTAFIVEGELTDVIRRRKMKNCISRLKGHYIVCGVSATGRHIIAELSRTGHRFVVIDRDPERIRLLTESEFLHIEGDATHEAVLVAANIATAEGLFTTLHHDADNLFVVVTAKGLRQELKIVAKASDEESERKLRMVGADRVVMPNYIGGLRMASEMIRPSVVSFLDAMLRSRDATVRVEEIRITVNSPLVGKPLSETGVLGMEGVTVVALTDNDGSCRFNPPRETMLKPDDVIIVMGVVDRISAMKARTAEA
ncbi:MAG: potassium channel protein [Deltaproteobacteria bacterium]|nr:potassium channel protein [Deltaproteobacteria bacterium]